MTGDKIGLELIVLTMTGSPSPISAQRIVTSQFEIYCDSTNAGDIYIGNEDVDSTWIPREASAKEVWTPSNKAQLAEGDYFDLSKLYVTGTSGDVIRIMYMRKLEIK